MKADINKCIIYVRSHINIIVKKDLSLHTKIDFKCTMDNFKRNLTSSVLLLLIKYTICGTHLDVAGVYIIRVTVSSQNNSGVIICKNKDKKRE